MRTSHWAAGCRRIRFQWSKDCTVDPLKDGTLACSKGLRLCAESTAILGALPPISQAAGSSSFKPFFPVALGATNFRLSGVLSGEEALMTRCPNGPGGLLHLQGESLDPSHADAVAALFEGVRSGAWSGEALRRELARSDGLALWMRQGFEAAAALLGRVVLDEFHILDVATAAVLRRQGLARRLLRQALSEAARRGARAPAGPTRKSW